MIRIFVHEPTSLWTAEFERSFRGPQGISFRWHPHVSDMLEDAALCDIIVLVVPATDESLDLIRELRRTAESTRLLCLVSEEESTWENVARECGVTSILPDVSMKCRVVELLEKLILTGPTARIL